MPLRVVGYTDDGIFDGCAGLGTLSLQTWSSTWIAEADFDEKMAPASMSANTASSHNVGPQGEWPVLS